ncbi:MucR family transcriptional regulator [Camelimonas lactis]|uniref:MucR family transcriptional regulator n=1 Tax=Camelimonas lactis TaxID=659006 RepID=A0A4R2GU27_9HYPH|nr:MucR family transcriptional regulator [Camelimonas lactis]TCO14161.1 MucR family transcriptional regulator [Camelimonas lactis]
MSELQAELRGLATKIICAYLSNHNVPPAELDGLIASVHAALAGAGGEPQAVEPARQALTAAQIRKSISPDFIICFENGKRYRSLTRHLRAAYGLSPEAYRAKWGLPPDYPMVAPNYAEMRSRLARDIGLGAPRDRSAMVGDAGQNGANPAPVARKAAAALHEIGRGEKNAH